MGTSWKLSAPGGHNCRRDPVAPCTCWSAASGITAPLSNESIFGGPRSAGGRLTRPQLVQAWKKTATQTIIAFEQCRRLIKQHFPDNRKAGPIPPGRLEATLPRPPTLPGLLSEDLAAGQDVWPPRIYRHCLLHAGTQRPLSVSGRANAATSLLCRPTAPSLESSRPAISSA